MCSAPASPPMSPNIRAEFAAAGVPFEGRVGRMMEGLRLARALWTGQPVDWQGRWPVKAGVLGPTPLPPGGPPIWMAGSVRPALERAARHFDGWFANEADLARWTRQWAEVQQILREAGRDPDQFVAAIYTTLAIDEDASRADQRIDAFLEELLRPAGGGDAQAAGVLWRAARGGGGLAAGLCRCRRQPIYRALCRRPRAPARSDRRAARPARQQVTGRLSGGTSAAGGDRQDRENRCSDLRRAPADRNSVALQLGLQALVGAFRT